VADIKREHPRRTTMKTSYEVVWYGENDTFLTGGIFNAELWDIKDFNGALAYTANWLARFYPQHAEKVVRMEIKVLRTEEAAPSPTPPALASV
jgi:hypothetical protein